MIRPVKILPEVDASMKFSVRFWRWLFPRPIHAACEKHRGSPEYQRCDDCFRLELDRRKKVDPHVMSPEEFVEAVRKS